MRMFDKNLCYILLLNLGNSYIKESLHLDFKRSTNSFNVSVFISWYSFKNSINVWKKLKSRSYNCKPTFIRDNCISWFSEKKKPWFAATNFHDLAFFQISLANISRTWIKFVYSILFGGMRFIFYMGKILCISLS